jgi:uncharacterized protein (UPF0332 family)
MNDFLKKYQDLGLIKKEMIGFDQINKQFSRAKQDLIVAEANLKIDSEVTYNYAYLAMLRTGRALMFSFRYRPIDGKQHKTVVDFAEKMLGTKYSDLVSYFNRMRKKRNDFTYDEPDIVISNEEAKNAIKIANEFVREVSRFIKEHNPQKELNF